MQLSGISVVIPAFNEEKYLPKTLEALNIARSNVNFPTEIVVVDNCSTDQTAKVAETYGARILPHELRNISSVRNAGIREARYDLILSIDADCITPPLAFQSIYDFMSKTEEFIGASLGLRLQTKKFSTRVMAAVFQFLVERVAGFQGAVFFFLRDEALVIGGFDESKLVAEDSTFVFAMRKHARSRGKKFGLLKSVQITTLDRKDMSLTTLAPLLIKLLRVFAGRKVSHKELAFWYDPDR
jgi:glycosyltransferase involved in cell wall biosynthesis